MTTLVLGNGFRTQTNLKGGVFLDSVAKLHQLLVGPLGYLGQDVRLIRDFNACPDTSPTYFRLFGNDSNAHRWMYRSQILSDRVRAFYDLLTADIELVIGFEAPQSLFQYCSEKGLPLVDFAFHFIRFGKDYSFMVRSSEPEFYDLFQAVRAPDAVTSIAARYSYTDCERVGASFDDLYGRSDRRNSIFVMQTRFDRSKFDGFGGIIDDYSVLHDGDLAFDYYKPHPAEPRPELEVLLEHRGARRLPDDIEVYPLIASRNDCLSFCGVSSGLIAEATLLGCRDSRMIVGFPWRVEGYETFTRDSDVIEGDYIPVTNAVLSASFWQHLLSREGDPPCISSVPFSVKEFWDVKWA